MAGSQREYFVDLVDVVRVWMLKSLLKVEMIF